MDVTGVFVVLTLFSHFEDVASQARYKEGMCLEFRNFLRSGDLYCNRDMDPIIGPDGKMHMNKCVMCRGVLKQKGYVINYETGRPGSINADQDDGCREYWPYFKQGRFACTRENDPVRDADGKQHSNKCMMCAEKFKNGGNRNSLEKNQVQNGGNEGDDECCEFRSQMRPDGGLTCTRENAPVRDASGLTHTNKCMMCAEKFKKEVREGKIGGGRGQSQNANGNRIVQGNSNQGNANGNNCKQNGWSSQGNNVYNPCPERIAQGDYRSYANCGGMGGSIQYNEYYGRQSFNPRQKRQVIGNQELNCDKILADLKREGTACNDLWSPVCGSDGNTYSNKCFLCLEIVKSDGILTVKHEGECTKAVHQKVNCSKYPQTRGRVLCKKSTQEVCGTDGETHNNECMLCDRILKTKSEIGVKSIGPCPQM